MVFSIRQHIVIGPTPPGTGVITDAFCSAAAKSTSPHNLPVSGSRFTPTSITTAPSEIMSAVTKRGRPIATTRISASRVTDGRSFVLLCAIVTVAFSSNSSFATGSPTILLRPMTTALFPEISTPADFSILMIPLGVHGTVQGCFCHKDATLRGWKPSTSLDLSIASMTFASEICSGRGSWTRMPSTSGSAFSVAIRASSSASVMSAGFLIVVFFIPTTSEALALPFTYDTLAGSSPTKTTTRCGTRPYFSGKPATCTAMSAFNFAESSLPLIIIEVPSILCPYGKTDYRILCSPRP